MSDARLRSTERAAHDDPDGQARLLREQLRAGVVCQAQVDLLALLGVAEARLIDGGTDHCHGCERGGVRFAGQCSRTGAARCADCLDLAAWLPGLQRLARSWVTGRAPACGQCGSAKMQASLLGCWWCEPCGAVAERTTAEHQVMVRAAVAAARPAWNLEYEVYCARVDVERPYHSEGERLRLARCAILDTEEWLACPCEEHRRALGLGLFTTDSPFYWLTIAVRGEAEERSVSARNAVLGFARLAGEAPVRTAISAALVPWVREQRKEAR